MQQRAAACLGGPRCFKNTVNNSRNSFQGFIFMHFDASSRIFMHFHRIFVCLVLLDFDFCKHKIISFSLGLNLKIKTVYWNILCCIIVWPYLVQLDFPKVLRPNYKKRGIMRSRSISVLARGFISSGVGGFSVYHISAI